MNPLLESARTGHARPCYENARNGDPRATRAVVDALRPRVARLALHYARVTGEDADDLLQDAMVGLLEALPVLDTRIGQPEPYLIQRAKWRMLDTIKRQRLRRCVPLDDAMPEMTTARGDGTAGTVCVWEFTGQLPANQRAVLDCLMDGMTWREAGDVLGCTSANVAYHVRRIRMAYEKWSG